MSTAKTTGIAGVVAAVAVAGTMLLSGDPATTGVSAGGLVPVRSVYVVPKGKKAIVKVYVAGKLKGADTVNVVSDSMVLHIKSQLIKTK
jgi:hypothetical protein